MEEREETIKKNSKRDMLIFLICVSIWFIAIIYSHFIKAFN